MMSKRTRFGLTALALALAATLTAALGAQATTVSGTINAAGSVFQANFQRPAIADFKSVDPGVTVHYSAVGSITGRADLYANRVLFAGSDSPIPASEKYRIPKGKTVLYFPVQFGPIALAYNLPGVTGLKLTPAIIAGIFQHTITRWNNPAIKALNPVSPLPSTLITPAVRSDSSDTTANVSQYLIDAASSTWKLGTGETITWPTTDRKGTGEGGVAQIVKTTPGAIGYMDYVTSKFAGLSTALIRNRAGAYVAPTTASAYAAATHVIPNASLTFLTLNEPGADSYPITYQSWDLVYAQQPSAIDVTLLRAYLGYLLGTGQNLLQVLYLAPLPASIDKVARTQLGKILHS